MKKVTIYILELYENKYFVGSIFTHDLPAEIKNHVAKVANEWTTKYKIKRLIYTEEASPEDFYEKEKNLILKTMEEKGIQNVRGKNHFTETIAYSSRYVKEIRGSIFSSGIFESSESSLYRTPSLPHQTSRTDFYQASSSVDSICCNKCGKDHYDIECEL